MTLENAIELIIFEACEYEGIVTQTLGSRQVDLQRFAKLAVALQTLKETCTFDAIPRKLAYALFSIAHHLEKNLQQGDEWEDYFYEYFDLIEKFLTETKTP